MAASIDAKTEDLLRFVGKPNRCDVLIRGTGRVLAERPSRAAVLRLLAELGAWEDELGAEGTQRDEETRAKLQAVTTLLGGFVAAMPEADEPLKQQLLRVLLEREQARPGDLADVLRRGRPQISQLLASLRADGLVEIAADIPSVDQRAVVYRPTSRARTAVA